VASALADVLLERRKELTLILKVGADTGVTGTDRFASDAVNSATSPVNINVTDQIYIANSSERN
jgi:hypothetical protein